MTINLYFLLTDRKIVLTILVIRIDIQCTCVLYEQVNSSKNTVTSRTPGNLSSTRLRKPTAFTLTPLQSKTTQQNTFANHRKTHLTDGKLQTVVNETLGK